MLFYAKAHADLPGCTTPMLIPIVDPGKSIVVEYAYDPWGKPIGNPWTLTSAYAGLGKLNPFL